MRKYLQSRTARAAGVALVLAGTVAAVAVLIVPVAFAAVPPKCGKSVGIAWGAFTPSRGHAPGGVSNATRVTITLTSGVSKVFDVLFKDGTGSFIPGDDFATKGSMGFTGNANQIQVYVPTGAVTGVLNLVGPMCFVPSPNRFVVQ